MPCLIDTVWAIALCVRGNSSGTQLIRSHHFNILGGGIMAQVSTTPVIVGTTNAESASIVRVRVTPLGNGSFTGTTATLTQTPSTNPLVRVWSQISYLFYIGLSPHQNARDVSPSQNRGGPPRGQQDKDHPKVHVFVKDC